MIRTLLFALLLAATGIRADDHAVILVYHHVANDTPASTSVTPEVFAAHLDYLDQHGFNVVPIGDVLKRLAERQPLPDNSVVITFDDAYESVYHIARPMLEVRGWPYTVFVSTAFIDGAYGGYMSWEQLRSIGRNGATIGNHGVEHRSALSRSADESRDAWLKRVRLDALAAQERIGAETGQVPKVFAWPYGEFNRDTEEMLAGLGWYGVGQQSGVAGYYSSLTAVPRYPIATNYAALNDFALRVNSEPLPVDIQRAPERLLTRGDPAPELSLRLRPGAYDIDRVTCYDSGGRRLHYLRDDKGLMTVQSPEPLSRGRSKYTCTAPHGTKRGVFGWYSHLWVVQ